jgi:hypothetical protein
MDDFFISIAFVVESVATMHRSERVPQQTRGQRICTIPILSQSVATAAAIPQASSCLRGCQPAD